MLKSKKGAFFAGMLIVLVSFFSMAQIKILRNTILKGVTEVNGTLKFITSSSDNYIQFTDGVSAGEKTFSNSGASADTVTISGATANSLYQITWSSDPGAPADWYVTAESGKLIVNTGSAVTGTPSYYWFRYEK